MLGVPSAEKRTNSSILQQTQIKKRLRTKIAEYTAKFFGHVATRNGLERLTVDGIDDG